MTPFCCWSSRLRSSVSLAYALFETQTTPSFCCVKCHCWRRLVLFRWRGKFPLQVCTRQCVLLLDWGFELRFNSLIQCCLIRSTLALRDRSPKTGIGKPDPFVYVGSLGNQKWLRSIHDCKHSTTSMWLYQLSSTVGGVIVLFYSYADQPLCNIALRQTPVRSRR